MSGRTGLQHVALLYDDVAGVTETVAGIADRDLAAGDAVLLCTPPNVTAGVRDHLGVSAAAADRLVSIPVGERYARPIDALSILWRTMADLLRGGAPRVNSIGEITFTGGPGDAAWMWYEEAVGRVFHDDPLTATCLYDTVQTPAQVLDMACCTHAHLQHGETMQESATYAEHVPTYPPPVVALPERAPDAYLSAPAEPAAARALVAGLGHALPADVKDHAQLVVTELVANSLRHAGGAGSVSVWTEPKRISLCVDDRGPGVHDPYATLRPPVWADHGRGLWLSHHAASELSLTPRPGGGTRAVAVVD